MKNKHNQKLHKRALLASNKDIMQGVFWIILFIVVMYVISRLFGFDAIQEKVKEAGAFGPLILIIAKASVIIFAPLGGGPLYFIAGPLFGFWPGFIYIFLGDMFGSVVAFYISRKFGRKVVRRFLSEGGMKYVDDLLYHMSSWKGFLYARILFIGMHDIVSYVAGLSSITFTQFISISVLVAVPPLLLVIAVGMALIDNIVLAGAVIAVAGIISLIVCVLGIRWFRRRSKE